MVRTRLRVIYADGLNSKFKRKGSRVDFACLPLPISSALATVMRGIILLESLPLGLCVQLSFELQAESSCSVSIFLLYFQMFVRTGGGGHHTLGQHDTLNL